MFTRFVRYQAVIKTATPSSAFKRSFVSTAYVLSNNNENNSNNENSKNDPEKLPTNKQEEEKIEEKETKPTVENELQEMTQKYKQLQAQYLLSLADQENLRKRTLKEVNNAKEYSIQKFAKDILDSVDILNLALKSVPNDFHEKPSCLEKEKEEIADQLINLYLGVSMTESELLRTLKRYDIAKDDPIDQEFDPNKHEAVFQAAVPDKKPGTIFVVQKVGYMMKNRILRPAQVGVVAEA